MYVSSTTTRQVVNCDGFTIEFDLVTVRTEDGPPTPMTVSATYDCALFGDAGSGLLDTVALSLFKAAVLTAACVAHPGYRVLSESITPYFCRDGQLTEACVSFSLVLR